MSTDYFTENTYEQALIELFEELGYNYQYGPDLQRDYRNPLLEEQLLESLRRLNPTLPVSALEDVVKALRQIEGSSLYERNFKFTQLMQNGVEVSYADRQHQVKTSVADLIDFEHPEQNDFLVVNQFTLQDVETKRPDIVVFVNGLPLVVIELKSPSCAMRLKSE